MVKMKKYFLFVLPFILSGCSSSEGFKAIEENVEYSFSFSDYDVINTHTPLQSSYLADTYDSIGKYAEGTSELSRPQTFTLSWTFDISTGQDVDYYSLSYTTNPDLNGFITHHLEDPSYTFTNLFIGTEYFYFVTANIGDVAYSSEIKSFETIDKGPRNVYVSGVTNARDLGGYTTSSGKRVKQGLVYRMGQLNERYVLNITPLISLNGRKTLLDDFKVKSEIDLREIYNNESGALYDSILGKEVNYFPYHMGWDVVNIPKNETEMMRNVFKVFTDIENYPIVFHCAIGTDRTGVVAFYLSALLGLEPEDIYRDYLFSNFGNIGGSRGLDNINSHFNYINAFAGTTLQEKAFAYFNSLGFTNDELNTICEIMLED